MAEPRNLSQEGSGDTIELTLAAINVSTLAKRLDMLLAWNYDVLMISEVRASAPSLRTLARRACARGYFSSWSLPPPRAATFSVAPGGVAILAKSSVALRTFKVPGLQSWVEQGRLVISKLATGTFVCALVCLYGFPQSHERHGDNESLFEAIHSWTMSLRIPVLIAGDWNESRQSSQFLSLCSTIGLFCISPDSPTTRSKKAAVAKSPAIDHILVNQYFLDLRVESCIEYGKWVSDHYPVVAKWKIHNDSVIAWDWPKPMSLGELVMHPEWKGGSSTMQEWNDKATSWLSEACQCMQKDKNRVEQHEHKKRALKHDHTLALFVRAQNLIASMQQGGEACNKKAWEKLRRKFAELEIVCPPTEHECHQVLHECLQRYMDHMQKKALDEWKKKVKEWHATSSQLYRYLKNVEPAKASAIVGGDGRLTNDPIKIWVELEAYWAQVETLPAGRSEDELIECLWDKYSLFMPCCHCISHLTPAMVMEQVKSMKKTSPGPDGWSKAELVLLPIEAWQDLLQVWENKDVSQSSLLWFRRVPLEKKSKSEPTADMYRPMYVFSMLLRTITSAHVRNLKGWMMEILMPTQYASRGGVAQAVDSLNVYAEAVIHGAETLWGVSVDFTKLFNSICPRVAIEAAKLLGLADEDAAELIKPFSWGCGFWRLPNNAAAPPAKHNRGLPQGLASSVMLSEVFLSVFLRKLHRCVCIDSVCYVDDITLVATTKKDLELALDLLAEFSSDFCLVVSSEKTALWGSDRASLQEMAASRGLGYSDRIEALGAEWVLHDNGDDAYAKEHARVEYCKLRLDRLAHLPSPIQVKAQAVSTGCLSLLAHSVSPIRKALNGTPLKIKRALGQVFAAPEVLYNILCSAPLDLMVVWALTLLRMFHFARKSDLGMRVLACLKKSKKHSRLASLLRYFTTLGWEYDGTHVITKVGELDLRKKWSWVREDFLVIAKRDSFRRLAARRPRVFEGITDVDLVFHRKLLQSVSPYQAALLCKIWSGSAMTRAHRHTISHEETPWCACGEEEQTIDHLLFRCPLGDSLMPEEADWAKRPPAQSVALLCPREADPDLKKVWRNICRKAVSVLSSAPKPRVHFDWRGHQVATTICGRFAYCGACHVTRKSRDSKFIAVKECRHAGQHPTWEGDYKPIAGHMPRCVFVKWKFSALRPRWVCVCGVSWWPECSPPVRACMI